MKKAFYVLAGSIFMLNACSEDSATNNDSKGNYGIVKPFETIDIKPTSFSVSAETPTELRLPNGSEIKIPANCFVDKNGNKIKGKVDINFREFHSLEDILISGIPMSYDSAGVSYTFESAGMFEMNGSQNNEAVNIAAGQNIEVNVASDKQDGDFNFYKLNKDGTWSYVSPMAVERNPEIEKLKDSLLSKLDKPVEPVKANKDTKVIDFNANYSAVPELKNFSTLLWQSACDPTSANNPEKNEWIYKENWTKANIVKTGKGYYTLELKNSGKSFCTEVKPVLLGSDYATAMKEYEASLAEYNKDCVKKLKENERALNENRFIRSASVNGFGVYNCDRATRIPEPMIVKGTFSLPENNDALQTAKYYIVEGTAAVYPIVNVNEIKFNPSQKPMIIAILPENKIAFTKGFPEYSATTEAKEFTFNLKVSDLNLNQDTDLKTFISTLREI